MRVSVIGVGAVGGTLAALLHRTGHEVHAVARGATLETIRRSGLRLRGAWGEHVAPIDADAAPARACDLVIAAVRSFQVHEALAPHRDAIGDAPVLVAANGMNGPGDAARALDRRHGVFGGMALFAATNAAPGEVTVTGRGQLRVGNLHPGDGAAAAGLAAQLNTALPTTATDNLRGALWMKLLVNHVNALPAITGMSVQATSRHPRLVPITAAALAETVRVVDALGVRLEAVGALAPAHAAMIRRGAAAQVVTGVLAGAFGTRPNPASTLQSIRRGQPTEIDDLNGAVVAAATGLRIPTPVHAALVRLVHEVERTGRFLAPDRVAAELGVRA